MSRLITPSSAIGWSRRFGLDETEGRCGLHHPRQLEASMAEKIPVFSGGALARGQTQQHPQVRPLAQEFTSVSRDPLLDQKHCASRPGSVAHVAQDRERLLIGPVVN